MRSIGKLLLMDLGSKKVRTAVMSFEHDSRLSILFRKEIPSSGFIHGSIANLKDAAETIQSAVAMSLEGAHCRRFDEIWVGHSGEHIRSENVIAEQSLSYNHPVTRRIERKLKIRAEQSTPVDYQLIHSFRQFSSIDGIRRNSAIDLVGTNILSRFHLIYTRKTAINNIRNAFKMAGVMPARFIFNAFASSQSVLHSEEQYLGCLLIHIGASTCDYLVYQEGQPFLSGSVNDGWGRLTKDVAMGLQIPLETAERLIITEGTTYDITESDNGPLNVRTMSGDQSRLTRRHLAKIMRCAAEETLDRIQSLLKNFICRGHIPGGVCLTGGAAVTQGLIYNALETFGVPVRLGLPRLPWSQEEFPPDWAPIVGQAICAAQEYQPKIKADSFLEAATTKVSTLWKRMFPKAIDPHEPEGDPDQ